MGGGMHAKKGRGDPAGQGGGGAAPMADPRRTAEWRRLAQQCFARDRIANAECANCKGANGPIRYDEPYSSGPWSYEADHIFPVEDHPELALDPSNVQASHRRCNRSRGKRSVMDALGNRSREW